MRNLTYIPMMHEEGDRLLGLGIIFGYMEEGELKEYSLAERNTWEEAQRGVAGLPQNLAGTKLYLEGVTNDDLEWVNNLNKDFEFFRNNKEEALPSKAIPEINTEATKIMIELLGRGAHLEVTENESFYEAQTIYDPLFNIVKEWEENLDLDAMMTPDEESIAVDALRKLAIIHEMREAAIAKNINKSLKDGESGLLMLGAHHDIRGLLDPDIEFRVITPYALEASREVRSKFHNAEEEFIKIISSLSESEVHTPPETKG